MIVKYSSESVMKSMFAILTAFALTACSSIPISSMYKLSRIDFMSTDLKLFRFAITLPNDIKPSPGGVHLDLAYQQGEKPEEIRVIKLEQSTAPADYVGLPNVAVGQKTYVYRLPTNEVNTLDKIRADAALEKAQGKKGSLGMGIAAKELCANNKILKAPLLVTTYVLSSENKDYVVLTRDIDLRSDATISASLDNLTPCSK
jgi:hypothetical protein